MNAPAWTVSTPLPRELYGMRGITLGNTVFLTGERTVLGLVIIIWCSGGWDGSHYRKEVLAWQGEGEEWVEVGMIESGRKFHAVTSIMTDNQAMQYCA